MTDATTLNAGPTALRRVTDALGENMREAVTILARVPARLAAMRAIMREQRDFDRIHDSLSRLNKRQLAMLGLNRDEIYTFTELCVYSPERRPVLRLHEAGPALALPMPEAEAPAAVTADEMPAPVGIESAVAEAEVVKADEAPVVETLDAETDTARERAAA